MVVEKYDGLVGAIAYEFSRKYKILDVDDVRQELWVWFLEHPNKVKVWEELGNKQSIKLIARSLRNAAKDYCQKQKAQMGGYRVEDNYYYDKELVEALLPAVIRGDLVAPAVVDLGFISGKKVASEGGNWFAMMADIDWGLEKLTSEQKSIIFLRYGDGCDNKTFAKELGITEDAARMRVNRALNNLINFLGGSKPRKERDYTEEEANAAAANGLHDAQAESGEHPQSLGEQDLGEETGSEVY